MGIIGNHFHFFRNLPLDGTGLEPIGKVPLQRGRKPDRTRVLPICMKVLVVIKEESHRESLAGSNGLDLESNLCLRKSGLGAPEAIVRSRQHSRISHLGDLTKDNNFKPKEMFDFLLG